MVFPKIQLCNDPSRERINQSRRQSSRLRGAKRLSGGQSLKLSTKVAIFKKVSLLIGGGQTCGLRGGLAPPLGTGSGINYAMMH